ncbi:TonB-dependent receptor [Parvularcula sp. LCG005]|uniref:TonB-dependent receptor n=1 Tax=Parvularcula sp. LCG005 TaxID=3078805 RepID=UPI002941DC7F|nr:TonB-dependent receptor [Parvularcula sp. LCG005]WOI52670.1 TonB-dependent receptor [Parvularcula sp. LCG005]
MNLTTRKGAVRLTSSVLALTTSVAFAAGIAAAQEEVGDVITVSGIRASLQDAMDIKRDSDGVVDAISAEDIGKFPDTNLAESLQRITGVAINRVNGEGSEVTVRGFGGGFNLVTLNGRAMPTANVATVGGDQSADFANGSSRSFDFSNLASEGVSGLQVYKTSNATIPSGGLGATINIQTARPLSAAQGWTGSVGAKLMHDTGVVDGDDITPELSGIVNWVNPEGTFGIGLFGSYQVRDSATVAGSSNAWNIERASQFLDPSQGRVNGGTQITGRPADGELVAFPNDSRLHLAESERERLNGQLVAQFRPYDNFTATVDYTYAKNEQQEARTDQTNWFNRPFGYVTFDGGDDVNTTVFLAESLSGVKDMGFEQQKRGNNDELNSLGFNAEWEVNENLTLELDAHTSSNESTPGNGNGSSSTMFSMGAPVIAAHALSWTSGFPQQAYTLNDSLRGNGNGVLDVGDLGTQVARTVANAQKHDLDEIRLDGTWEMDSGSSVMMGVDYRTSTMTQTSVQTQQQLGDWGITNPGDVAEFAPGLVETYCLSCLYDDYDPGMADIAFKGDAEELYAALSTAYAQQGNAVSTTANAFNEVAEDIFGAYAQFHMEGEFLDRPASFNAGIRYEYTEVESTALVAVPTAIIWQSDNDFTTAVSSDQVPVTGEGSYSNVLPALDFKLDITDNLVGRVSWGKSIARPGYGSLFVTDSALTPPRPTALGGIASGTRGNPGLLPLESDNFDVSLEWYYAPTSYVSAGFYEKRVRNFQGTGQFTSNLFDLRDPSSGAAGSRSGDALDYLQDNSIDPTDVNLFTMTALIIQNGGNVAAAAADFQANYSGGSLDQAFVDQILADVDVSPNADDPLFMFEVTQPINNRDARLYGFELAAQHFFGDTGFGLAGSYTSVNGDVEIDNGADPSVDQFALVGLSDTYNITGIYENYGVSARLSYNWRDEYLSETNRGGGARNPVYYEPFGQLDLNVSYNVTEDLIVSFEGLNLTEEGVRTFGRDPSNLWFAQELDARYLIGARYKF